MPRQRGDRSTIARDFSAVQQVTAIEPEVNRLGALSGRGMRIRCKRLEIERPIAKCAFMWLLREYSAVELRSARDAS